MIDRSVLLLGGRLPNIPAVYYETDFRALILEMIDELKQNGGTLQNDKKPKKIVISIETEPIFEQHHRHHNDNNNGSGKEEQDDSDVNGFLEQYVNL